MKSFQFSLETVLTYKQQVLDTKKAEHAAAAAAVQRQEDVLKELAGTYASVNREYRDRAAAGLSVAAAMYCENELRRLEASIRREEQKLKSLQKREKEKQALLVEAKQETSSLEKLRAHKVKSYQKELQKSEEAFIDELVSASWAGNSTAEERH